MAAPRLRKKSHIVQNGLEQAIFADELVFNSDLTRMYVGRC